MNCSKCNRPSHALDCQPGEAMIVGIDPPSTDPQPRISSEGTVEFEVPLPPPGTRIKIDSHKYIVKDSGKREDFTTGARRDTQDGKGDFSRLPYGWLAELVRELQRRNKPEDRVDLLPVDPLLRLSAVYGRGAAKYGEHNYQKGIPISRCISSLQRHIIAYAEGDTSEDHMAQVAWNAFAIIFMDEGVRAGVLPREVGDYGPLANPTHKAKKFAGAINLGTLTLRKGEQVCMLKEMTDGNALCVQRLRGATICGTFPTAYLEPLAAATTVGTEAESSPKP